MNNMLYCVIYENINKPYYGYIKPYNGVRDIETFSCTYLPPSFIDGIKKELECKGNIVRHKLLFSKDNPMQNDFIKAVCYGKDNQSTIHTRHLLVNPIVIFAFENKDDAINALNMPLHFGQTIYPIYPLGNVKEMTNDEFDELPGVETFLTTEDDDNGVYCGNNRNDGNKRMYIRIDYKEW